MIHIEPASSADLPGVVALLRRNGLPVDGLSAETDVLLVARDDNALVGSAALERYGADALLRSVAVDAAYRGSGLGQRLTSAALETARQRGVRDLFLLTTTAEHFFPRFGFEPVERDAVPELVRLSVEFTTACPASAVVLRKQL